MSSPIDETDAAASVVSVTVTRTGGIAGLRRTWSVAPPPDEAARWAGLIAGCPWDSAAGDPVGADRFVWDIRAACDGSQLDARLAEQDAMGPWRELIEAVRAQDAAAALGEAPAADAP